MINVYFTVHTFLSQSDNCNAIIRLLVNIAMSLFVINFIIILRQNSLKRKNPRDDRDRYADTVREEVSIEYACTVKFLLFLAAYIHTYIHVSDECVERIA